MNRIGEVTALVPMYDKYNQSLMMEQTGATSSFTEEDVKHYLHEVLIKIRNKEKWVLRHYDFALHIRMKCAVVVKCSRDTELVLKRFSCSEVA